MDPWVNQRENKKKYVERNKNENMMSQNLWDTAKAVQRGQLIMIQAYLRL